MCCGDVICYRNGSVDLGHHTRGHARYALGTHTHQHKETQVINQSPRLDTTTVQRQREVCQKTIPRTGDLLGPLVKALLAGNRTEGCGPDRKQARGAWRGAVVSAEVRDREEEKRRRGGEEERDRKRSKG